MPASTSRNWWEEVNDVSVHQWRVQALWNLRPAMAIECGNDVISRHFQPILLCEVFRDSAQRRALGQGQGLRGNPNSVPQRREELDQDPDMLRHRTTT